MFKGHKQPGKRLTQKQREGLNVRWEQKMDKLTEWKQKEDSCRFSKCQYVLPVPTPRWLQEYPLQSATHPLKSTQSLKTLSSKAKPCQAPAMENFPHPHSQLWWEGVSPCLLHSARKGWSLRWPDFLARWPVPLSQEVPHNFSDQTHLKRGCCSQHPMRHGPWGSDLPWLEHY